jgi:hypothetical protein
MKYRKRSMLQHKVALSTLLPMAIANEKSGKFQGNGNGAQNLTKALASEAIESLKNDGHCLISKTKKILVRTRAWHLLIHLTC